MQNFIFDNSVVCEMLRRGARYKLVTIGFGLVAIFWVFCFQNVGRRPAWIAKCKIMIIYSYYGCGLDDS